MKKKDLKEMKKQTGAIEKTESTLSILTSKKGINPMKNDKSKTAKTETSVNVTSKGIPAGSIVQTAAKKEVDTVVIPKGMTEVMLKKIEKAGLKPNSPEAIKMMEDALAKKAEKAEAKKNGAAPIKPEVITEADKATPTAPVAPPKEKPVPKPNKRNITAALLMALTDVGMAENLLVEKMNALTPGGSIKENVVLIKMFGKFLADVGVLEIKAGEGYSVYRRIANIVKM